MVRQRYFLFVDWGVRQRYLLFDDWGIDLGASYMPLIELGSKGASVLMKVVMVTS